MQSNKASKKTLKIAEETVAAAPENSTATEPTANPRASRSSKPKKNEINEPMSAKHHRKASPLASEVPNVDGSPAARTMAASVESQYAKVATPQVTREQIAELAHSYWVARGYAHGSAEQDWLRAERELTRRS